MGFKIGALLAALHLCLAMLAFLAMVKSHSSTAGLVFIWFFFLDAPLLLLLPPKLFNVFGIASPLIQFGVIGSALWFSIPWLIDKAVVRIFPNGTRTVRVLVIIGALPFLLAGFYRLSYFSTKLSLQKERLATLNKMNNSAASDFLTGKVVFEDYAPGGFRSINRVNYRPGVGMEILLALPRAVVFLNESYQDRYRLSFPVRNTFQTIEPLNLDGAHSYGFLAHMFAEGAFLFSDNGKVLWRHNQLAGGKAASDGVCSGDIDGDGKPEFAIYYPYREGIHLVDREGKIRWKHPVYALGHLEMADVRRNGTAEIIYSNSNNANGFTDFIILDANGTEVSHQKFATASSEFAVIRWPKKEAMPNILLTEEGRIRLVDVQGAAVMNLEAPGCKASGKLNAVTVRFKNDEPAYLAVKKSIHPDLSVLYVYDANGKRMFQKTDVIVGLLEPTLATASVKETGVERLLAGESSRDFKAKVVEYSLSR